MSNSFGRCLRFMSFGESHGPLIGAVLDNCPPSLLINEARLAAAMRARRPGQPGTSQRRETDEIRFSGGVERQQTGLITTGGPIAFLIENADAKPQDYAASEKICRPGHAEYPYLMKYGRSSGAGGGRASARETALRVAAGALAAQFLEQLLEPAPRFHACLLGMGPLRAKHRHSTDTIPNDACSWPAPLQDPSSTKTGLRAVLPADICAEPWEKLLAETRKDRDSLGALVGLHVTNVPAGLGAPVYAKLDADLAAALMGINAAKAVEIGAGLDVVSQRGSSCTDALYPDLRADAQKRPFAVTFRSNNHGGIIAGISTHAPITARVAFKPTASIARDIPSVDHQGRAAISRTGGRHDPCVGIRAVGVVAAMAALVILDHFLCDIRLRSKLL